MLSKLRWSLIIIVISILVGVLSVFNFSSVIRPVVIFLFMLVIPGLAFTRLLKFKDAFTELIIAVALSLVISTIMAEFMVFSHLWSPMAGLAVLIAVSIYGASIQIIRELKLIPLRLIDDNDH